MFDSNIPPLERVHNLGSWFDTMMSTSVHIGKICGKAFYGLFKIRQIRNFLSPKASKTLIHAFVTWTTAILFLMASLITNLIERRVKFWAA